MTKSFSECHEDVIEKFKTNIHSKNEKIKGFGYVSCYGSGRKHAEDTSVESI